MSLIERPIEEAHTEIVYVDETEAEKFDNASLDNVISELGGDSTDDILLKVYRVNKVTKKDEFCFNSSPEELPLEPRLVSEYGSGEFTVRVMVPNEQGRKSLKRRLNISIAERLNSYVEPVKNDSADIKEIMSGMMEAISQSQTNMMQLFRESQLESQNKTQELLITVLGNKDNQEKQPTLLETMAALKSLTPDTKDPMEVFGQMLTMNREIKAEMTPETPPAEGSFAQLMDGANKLMDLAGNAPKPPQPAQPAQPAQPQQNKIEGQAPNKQEQTNMNALIKMKLKSSLNMLNEKAKAGSNPALWADVTIDEVPEQYYPQLIDALGENDEQGFTNLMSINPVIEANKEWFIEFIAEIRTAFVGSNEPENEENLTSGDVSGDDIENNPLPEIETDTDVDTETANISKKDSSNT